MSSTLSLCLVAAVVSLTIAVYAASPAADQQPSPAEKTLASDGNAFATDLYANPASQRGNLFSSPYSIRTALAMAYAGARGQTETQMAAVLHFALPQNQLHSAMGKLNAQLNSGGTVDGKQVYELVVANALWGQKGFPFLKTFEDRLTRDYGAGLHEVDFARATEQARQDINAWVEKQTRDKIKDLVPPGALHEDTRLVIANAIYFKGKWAEPFDKAQTQDQPFHLDAARQANVPLMHRLEDLAYLENDQFQAVELPYASYGLSMVVFLPKKIDGLPAFEKTLTAENLEKWCAGLHRHKVDLFLPRFKMEARFELSQTLSAMGMADAFSQNADFSGMATAEKLCISQVLHKAYVDVNEEGTEAAAATGITMMPTAMPARPIPPAIFRADHPFFFLIRQRESGAVLFMGRVVDPR